MAQRIALAAFLLTLASPALAQRGPRLEVSLLAANSPPAGASVIAGRLLADSKMRELLRSGFPAAMTFRLELWRVGGMFDDLENVTQWNALVRYEPYTQEYLAIRRHGRLEENFGGFSTLEAAEAAMEKAYAVILPPRRVGARYYYNLVVDVESLNVNDLDELQRWLRGEFEPAVRGKRAPLSALRRGFGTLLSRLLGGEARHYESRTGTFRA